MQSTHFVTSLREHQLAPNCWAACWLMPASGCALLLHGREGVSQYAPDMLTPFTIATNLRAPKPYFAINASGVSLRIARCTIATLRNVLLLANRLPNAALAFTGTPSQNVYACVAGSSVPCALTCSSTGLLQSARAGQVQGVCTCEPAAPFKLVGQLIKVSARSRATRQAGAHRFDVTMQHQRR